MEERVDKEEPELSQGFDSQLLAANSQPHSILIIRRVY